MSYALARPLGQFPSDSTMQMSSMTTTGSPVPGWVPWAIGGVFFALIGAAIYVNYKVATKIAEKQGAGGVLAYEAGLTGLGLLGEALRRPTRNAKRRSRRSR